MVMFLPALSLSQKALWFRQLNAVLNSGLSLHHALGMTTQGMPPAFQQVLQAMAATIATGQDLATTMRLYPQYFDHWTISLIRLAEYSGTLAPICQRLAEQAEQQRQRERLYRSLSLTLGSMLASGFLTLAVWKYGTLFVLQPQVWFLFGVLFGACLLAKPIAQNRRLNPWLYQIASGVPIVGHLIQVQSILFLADLRLPLSSGVPILTALELIRDRCVDPRLAVTLSSASRQVRAGRSLSDSLQGAIAPMAQQMIRTGEETGQLEEMLQKLAEYYDGELERALKTLQGILRPCSALLFGLLIVVLGWQGMRSMFNAFPD